MKLIRWGGLGASMALVIISIILLLNFTALNPTGRRYSSQPVVTLGSSSAIGLSAERILAADLRLPRNDDPDQRQCICNSPNRTTVSQCRVCIAYSQSVASYRRPDFVSTNFIAESKNRSNALYTDNQLIEQIGDYTIAARALNVPLWIYVRTDTEIDEEYYRLVRGTGGNIIHYFRTEDYTDPIDRAATYGVGIGGVGLVLFGLLMFIPWNRGGGTTKAPTPKPKPKPSDANDPINRASQSVDQFAGFVEKSKESSQRKIDQETAREDID